MMDDDRDRGRVAEWLREEADHDGPPTYLDAVLATTSHTRQLPSWRGWWAWLVTRSEHLIGRRPRLLWPVLAVLALGGVLVVGATWRPQSPGREVIAYSAGDGLYVVQPDGSDLRRIADDVRILGAAWSPDGSRLLVGTEEGGLLAIGADGQGAVDLLPGAAIDARTAGWAPDGGRIVMSATDAGRPGSASVLYSVAVDGSDLRPVEAVEPGGGAMVPVEGEDPAWSPDGRWIAFTDMGSGRWIVRTDGSQRLRLGSAPTVDGVALGGISWAPDSTRVTYAQPTSGTGGGGSIGVVVIGIDGADERLISTDARVQVAPSWSPDGRRIAWFVESRDGYRIVLFDVGGDQAAELRTDAAFAGGWLAWSPDASWVVTYTADLERLALIRADRTAPDRYVTAVGRITGVSWQP